MPTTTTITIGGTATSPPRELIPERLIPISSGGHESFSFAVRGGALPATNPYTGKSVSVTINGTLRYTGVVTAMSEPTLTKGVGWVRKFQTLGLSYIADTIRHTDSRDFSDRSTYNAPKDTSPTEYNATRAGRTVGQVLTDILTMPDNAANLYALGVGNYTGMPTTPTLPAATVADLTDPTTGLNWIPPAPMTFGGPRFWSAFRSFVQEWAPNHVARILPDGTIRVLKKADFTLHTFDWDSDPIQPSSLSRDTTECASHLSVQGAAVAEMFCFGTDTGTLGEGPFAYGGLTVAQVKAKWRPEFFRQPGLVVGQPGDDEGTCTCPSTTTVTVTSSNAAQTWVANYWDATSTGHQGTFYGFYSLGTTAIDTFVDRGIVSNTSLAAAGTSTLTLDRALPHTNFDHYVIVGLTGNRSTAYTVYQLVPSWAQARVAPAATRGRPFKVTSDAPFMLQTTAVGMVAWSSNNMPPYSQVTIPVVVDPGTGYVHFPRPTRLLTGGAEPSIVRAFVPIYTIENTVELPADVGGVRQYGGKFYTEDGVEKVLALYVPAWKDPLNATAVTTWANEVFDTIKDPVREGTISYYGLHEAALDPLGMRAKVTSTAGSETGWGGEEVPVVDVELAWGILAGDPNEFTTTLRVSNRRSHLSVEQFLKPDRTGLTLDFQTDENGFGLDMTHLAAPDLGGRIGGSVNVDDLSPMMGMGPNSLSGMPNPTAGMPDPAAGMVNPGASVPNPGGLTGVGPDNTAFDEAGTRAVDRLGRQLTGRRAEDDDA